MCAIKSLRLSAQKFFTNKANNSINSGFSIQTDIISKAADIISIATSLLMAIHLSLLFQYQIDNHFASDTANLLIATSLN
jgi:hypothetical protein